MPAHDPRSVIQPPRSQLLRLRGRLRLLPPLRTLPHTPLLMLGLGLLCLGVAGCAVVPTGWMGGGLMGLILAGALGALSLSQTGCQHQPCFTPEPTPTPTRTPAPTAQWDSGDTSSKPLGRTTSAAELRIDVSQRLLAQGNLPPDVAEALRKKLAKGKRS